MPELQCRIAESRIKPLAERPLLTLFVLTHNRTPEMVATIENLAGQLTGGLERKVEILISDNASGPEGVEAIRGLADRFETVSYMINADNKGGLYQTFMAPWRSRGVWTWMFGSDDLMEPGTIADIVGRLEAHDPDFLTMDKQIWNRDFSKQLYARANGIPDRTFGSFIDLFKGVGIHQISYFSACLEKTEAGRRIDAETYCYIDSQHSYTLAYFEKHQSAKCMYIADAPVLRRLDNSGINDFLGVVFEDIGLHYPFLLLEAGKPFGVRPELFEEVNGSRFIDSYDPPRITFVDNLFEYILRGAAAGRHMTFMRKTAFEKLTESWRPERREQFEDIWQTSLRLEATHDRLFNLRSEYETLLVQTEAERAQVRDAAMRRYSDKKMA